MESRARATAFSGTRSRHFAGQVRLEDEDGDQIQTSDYDAAPILGLNGEIAF